jgi:hypothetical protein
MAVTYPELSTNRWNSTFLVSHLQALSQTGRVQLPKHHVETEAMATELMDYEIRISEDANDRYGAFRVGRHDDLVTALGLAVIIDPRAPGFVWAVA